MGGGWVGGGGGGEGSCWGGQGGCERRNEFFGKFRFFFFFFWGGGVRWGVGLVDVNEELKFLCFCEIKKKNWGEGVRVRGWVVVVWGSGWGGQGGCERRNEVVGKIHTKKFGGGRGRDGGSGGAARVGGGGGLFRVNVNKN